MGLFEHEKKHNRLLRKIGAECTVLLKKDGSFPLKGSGDIALYGSGARRTIKGGTGSGEVNSRFMVTIEKGLKRAGFNVLTTDWLDIYDEIYVSSKKKFISDVKKEAKKKHVMAMTVAMGRTMPEPEYDIPISAKCDTAIYVLSRISGEGCDRDYVSGDILLTETEIRDIAICNEKYKNFMLVLNVGGVVDISCLGFVKNILLLSQLGVKTGDTLADIILGRRNPSGKLTTTWADSSSYQSIGSFGEMDDTEYREGIYVGYRYFDTVGKIPEYPFGFGLSYTEFELSDYEASIRKDVVTVSANVKNTGKYSGKEVLQLYVSIPEGKLDEPYQVLAGFAKTKNLAPGAKENLKISFSMKDIAPYSESDSAYILEAGDYILRIGNSSRRTEIAGCVRVKEQISVERVKSITTSPSFKDWKRERDEAAFTMPEGVKVLKLNEKTIEEKIVEYGTKKTINEAFKDMTDEELAKAALGAFNSKSSAISMVGNAGFSVAGSAGQTITDFEAKGLRSLVMADGPAGLRISKHYVSDENGVHIIGESPLPESVREWFPKPLTKVMELSAYRPKKGTPIRHQYTTAIPIGTAIAQSFNIELAEMCGDIVGTEMEIYGVDLWLAPALNIHRDIRCGRNFEYFSEDPLVSGQMAAAITRGVQSHKGRGTTIKHFAANNQELNRTQNNSVMSERTLREIYLKGFKICIGASHPAAVMTSYNLINGVHTSESEALTKDALRSEFGHEGLIMTDWVIRGFNKDDSCKWPIAMAPKVIKAGGNVFMPGSQGDLDEILEALDKGELTRDELLINISEIKEIEEQVK